MCWKFQNCVTSNHARQCYIATTILNFEVLILEMIHILQLICVLVFLNEAKISLSWKGNCFKSMLSLCKMFNGTSVWMLKDKGLLLNNAQAFTRANWRRDCHLSLEKLGLLKQSTVEQRVILGLVHLWNRKTFLIKTVSSLIKLKHGKNCAWHFA